MNTGPNVEVSFWAVDADIAGELAHSKALDADTKGPLRDIHRRVGTAILFESSGGQTDKVAHLPELRFALGEPLMDTTSIDNAAFALEDRSYYVRKARSDGFRIGYLPTMKVGELLRGSLLERTVPHAELLRAPAGVGHRQNEERGVPRRAAAGYVGGIAFLLTGFTRQGVAIFPFSDRNRRHRSRLIVSASRNGAAAPHSAFRIAFGNSMARVIPRSVRTSTISY